MAYYPKFSVAITDSDGRTQKFRLMKDLFFHFNRAPFEHIAFRTALNKASDANPKQETEPVTQPFEHDGKIYLVHRIPFDESLPELHRSNRSVSSENITSAFESLSATESTNASAGSSRHEPVADPMKKGMATPRAWSFLTVEGEPQYGGNAGHEDDPAEVYRYDGDVANCRKVSKGDLVLLRSGTKVLGIARIEKIVPRRRVKERLRCPDCHDTNIKPRISKQPRYKCRCGLTFDLPEREAVTVDAFEAHYGHSFCAPPPALTLRQLEEAVIRPNDQMSIKELDLSRIEEWLMIDPHCRQLVVEFAGAMCLDDSVQRYSDAAPPQSIIEERRRVLREVNLRRGQPQFRERLIRRYGGACQISRCAFPGLVEAAHIAPYALTNENGVLNGLLLRSDLHTLFDLWFLAIDPASMTVALHPDLMDTEYRAFKGRPLYMNGTSGPDRPALQRHWDFFCRRLLSEPAPEER